MNTRPETEVIVPSDVQNYLSQVAEMLKMNKQRNGFLYGSKEEFVQKNGQEFKPQEFDSSKYPDARRTPKECFSNAWHLASETGLTYVEGFAFNVMFPMLHAWCVDQEGNVVDPTWKTPEDCQYFGVPFSMEYVNRIIFKRKRFGVIDNMQMDFPLLTGKHTDFKNG